jgi:hypothetical protein
MAITQRLASFPNSRGKDRSATRTVDEYKGYAPSTADGAGTTMPQIGGHVPLGNVTANLNQLLVAANSNRTYCFIRNLHPTDTLYFNNNDVANIGNEGNEIRALEGYDIEHVEDVYVKSSTGNRIIVQVEEGEG